MQNQKQNKVFIEGYLKENTLEVVSFAGKDGKNVNQIRGSLIVAVDPVSSYKVEFKTWEKRNVWNDDGSVRGQEDVPLYKKLLSLLPANTTTIRSFQKANPSTTYETALNMSSKVNIMATFEENVFKSSKDGSVVSRIKLVGHSAAFSVIDTSKATNKEFRPHASFVTDIYIEAMTPESIDGKETGRILIDGIYADNFSKVAHRIPFVAVTEDGVAKYIADNYSVTDTVTIKGDLANMVVKEQGEVKESNFFGRGSSAQYTTKFIDERRIFGGSKEPIRLGSEGSYTTDFIKNALANREVIIENSNKKATPKATLSLDNFDDDIGF